MTTQVNGLPGQNASPPTSLAELAYEAIRDMVVTLEISPGAAISEEALMKQLDLGRTPVHEAIKRLESERLVAIYPRRGTFATEVNITDLALITEIRLALVPLAARSAAKRCTSAEREELRGLVAALDELDGSSAESMRMDTVVQRTIYGYARNPYLEANLRQYYNLVQRIWYLFLERLPQLSEHIAEHKALLEAIIDGDEDRAGQLAYDHVSGFEQAVRSIL